MQRQRWVPISSVFLFRVLAHGKTSLAWNHHKVKTVKAALRVSVMVHRSYSVYPKFLSLCMIDWLDLSLTDGMSHWSEYSFYKTEYGVLIRGKFEEGAKSAGVGGFWLFIDMTHLWGSHVLRLQSLALWRQNIFLECLRQPSYGHSAWLFKSFASKDQMNQTLKGRKTKSFLCPSLRTSKNFSGLRDSFQ